MSSIVQEVVPEPSIQQTEPVSRSLVLTFLARVGLVYLFLSNWVWVLELIVNPSRPIRPVFDAVYGRLARFLGYKVFHLTGPLAPNSFRDTRYLYLLLLVIAITSLAASMVWAGLDRDGRQVKPAYKLLRVWIRYTLAYMVIIYGMNKVFRLQFPFPGMKSLVEPLGDFSPMAVLWAYVGFSPVLTIFSGAAEVGGAFLLLFRRTAPLGALITVVMMANIFLMDFCYDVSVKMLALHFLAMSIFLLANDAGRLLNVLAFNRPAPPVPLHWELPRWFSPRARRYLPLLKLLVVLYVIVPVTIRTYRTFRQSGPYAAHVPFYGLYRVDSFAVNGRLQPPLAGDQNRWHNVVIEGPNEIMVQTMDNGFKGYPAKYDAAHSRFSIGKGDGTSPSGSLSVSHIQPDEIALTGNIGRDNLDVHLHRIEPSQFVLVNRGFHWVNETSFVK